jgi:uncharacterized protein YlxW (UPF0749 family)
MHVFQVVVQTPAPPPLPGMDPNFLISQLAPLVVFIGVAIVGVLAVRWFFRSPLAEALAERLRARTRHRFGEAAEVEADRVAGLEHQVVTLQGQLSELAERVDFAERLLAERRERKLSAGQ